VLLHRQFWQMAEMVKAVPGLFAEHDRVLLYLPLAHNFARLVQYAGAAAGFTLAFCPDVSLVAQSLKEVRPTIFPSVPRVFEKMYDLTRARLDEATGLRRRIARHALAVGAKVSAQQAEGRRLPPGLGMQRALADRLVYRKVRALLGGELRLAVSGGAPLSPEIAQFFASLGILILEGYGLTECTTASHMNWPRHYRFGTVGLALPGVETRAAEDGEILLRAGTVFVGYHGDPAATAATVDTDGWLHTGDIGSLDADGFLTITDRKKDIIVTSGGKNVSPQNIENALRSTPAIAQALVIGNRRPYLTALIVPEQDAARTSEELAALVEQDVAGVNRELGRVEQIRRFAVLERDFSADLGEVTPTLKLRRHVCEEHFGDLIDSLYTDTSPDSTPL
jgi:long-chain acyl-CoA synthetase